MHGLKLILKLPTIGRYANKNKMLRPRRIIPRRGGKINPNENLYFPRYSGDLENFKIYLNAHESFVANFPKFVRYRWSDTCDKTNNDGIIDDENFEGTTMSKTMAAVWVATYECGISQEDLKKPGITGALFRFHVYFTARKILRRRFYNASVIKKVKNHLPTKYEVYDYKKGRVCKLIEITDKDFIFMTPPKTMSITNLGVGLLQESVMTYAYALLAAQVVNKGKNIIGTNEWRN